MAFDHKNGSGSLFKNDRKKKEKHPDYRGTAKIHGTEVEISAWLKKGAKGTYMSLAFTDKAPPPPQDEEPPPPPKSVLQDDSEPDVPF